MVAEIKEQIQAYCKLRFTENELQYLDSIKWIKGGYVDFLRLWSPRYEDFTITTDGDCGLSIETAGTFSEFGLRRRLSAEAHELVVEKFSHLNDTMHSLSKFIGTSNVYLAKKFGLK